MARSGRRRIYWDSCVWLYYLNNTMPDQKPILDALLADSKSNVGDIEILTSAISQVEVAFTLLEQQQQAVSSAQEKLIDSLWADDRAITLVEYYPRLLIEARALIRQTIDLKISTLKPLDAIHLATANRMHVTEFHTYDNNLIKCQALVDFQIQRPFIGGVSIIQPELPDLN